MNKTKTFSGISKIRRLITVLQKCNGKAQIGGKDALISQRAIKIFIVVGLLLLTGALFTVFYLLEPAIAPFIPIKGVTQGLMLIMLLMSFMLSVKNIVTVLYTADDLPVLLPMPLSAGQIVTAKLAVASRFTVGLSLILINSVCLGLGIRAGMGAAYVIGTLLSSVLIPVTGISIATLLIVVVFRVFGFIRNRDITMVIGGIFTLLLITAYIIISNRFNSENSSQAALTVFNSIASVSASFPNISSMTDFMIDSSIAGLFISIGVSVIAAALALLAVKLFYLSTALSMQNTGSKSKAVTKEALEGKKKASILRALTSYESKNARRNPAYMIYGFAMSFLWPLMIGIPMFFSARSMLESLSFPLDMRTAALCGMLFGIISSCFSCGLNVLACSAFSREGATFSALRSMPIDLRDYYKSKRNFAMMICTLSSAGYSVIFGVVCLFAGILTFASSWVILLSVLISFLINSVFVNWLLVHNSKKPYFNWDSETEISRKLCWKNTVAIIIGLIAFIGFLIILGLSSESNFINSAQTGMMTTITVIAVIAGTAIALILAFAVNRYSISKGVKNLAKID